MRITPLFPMPVYEHDGTIDEIFLIQDEIKKKLPIIFETDKFENPPGWNDGVQTNIKARHHSIRDFGLVHLEKYIEKHVANYIKAVGAWEPVPTKLVHSWINLTSHGQRQDWHTHQDSSITGTYYYQTNGEDGDFTFETPNPYTQLEIFPYGEMVQKYSNVQPKVGKIILFPGWVNHRVEVNKTDHTRISISFNCLRDHFHNQRS